MLCLCRPRFVLEDDCAYVQLALALSLPLCSGGGMKLALFLAIALIFHAADAKVQELTPKEFKKTVLDSKDVWMVLFYAPWCGHCKALFPEWKKLADAVSPSIKVAQVDADAHKDLGGQYGVKGAICAVSLSSCVLLLPCCSTATQILLRIPHHQVVHGGQEKAARLQRGTHFNSDGTARSASAWRAGHGQAWCENQQQWQQQQDWRQLGRRCEPGGGLE
jgi:thiol-disulfide isomerase/thioredoxin